MLIGIYAYCRRGQLSIIIVLHMRRRRGAHYIYIFVYRECVSERIRYIIIVIYRRETAVYPGQERGGEWTGKGYDFTMRLRFDCNCLVCAAVTQSVAVKAPLVDSDRKLMTSVAAVASDDDNRACVM